MTIPEAIIILEASNKWRRGVDLLGNDLIDFPMPDPTEFGKAIDLAVFELKKITEVTGSFKTLTFRSKV